VILDELYSRPHFLTPLFHRADEGAFVLSGNVAKYPEQNPPSSGFATFSPRKKRGGRRRSIIERGERIKRRLKDVG
jgi:hypothetical protein